MFAKFVCLTALALAANGCKSESASELSPKDAGETAEPTKKLGAAGGLVGSLDTDGVSIDVPPGALDKDITITVTAAGAAPSGYEATSRVFRFEPKGTVFKQPITITLTMDHEQADAVVYFTKPDSEQFEDIGGKASGKSISTMVTHFSDAFAGLPGGMATALDGGDGGNGGSNSAAAGGGAGAGGAAGSGAGAGCPPAGTYTLINFKCGSQDVTMTWKSIIPTSTLTFSTQGDECKMLMTNSSNVCTEIQEELFIFGANPSAKSLGITSCSPDACKFHENDAPCMKGDRARTREGGASPFDVKDGRFTIHTPANTGDVCDAEEGIQVFDLDPNAKFDTGPAVVKYNDNGDGTVTDAGNKLTWQQLVPADLFAWDAAVTHCTGLALAGSGWRLPTVNELLTLVDVRAGPTHIDATFFPDNPTERFWTADPNGSSQHWYVDFESGLQNAGKGSEYRVRCVRAAP